VTARHKGFSEYITRRGLFIFDTRRDLLLKKEFRVFGAHEEEDRRLQYITSSNQMQEPSSPDYSPRPVEITEFVGLRMPTRLHQNRFLRADVYLSGFVNEDTLARFYEAAVGTAVWEFRKVSSGVAKYLCGREEGRVGRPFPTPQARDLHLAFFILDDFEVAVVITKTTTYLEAVVNGRVKQNGQTEHLTGAVLVVHHGEEVRFWDYMQGTPTCRVNISVGVESASYQVGVVRDGALAKSFPDSTFGVYDAEEREKTIILNFLRKKKDETNSDKYENGQHFRKVIYD
jgi:hypothetical protein